MGHLRVTVGHPRVTIGHLRVTIGHLRVIMGHLRLTIGYLCTDSELWSQCPSSKTSGSFSNFYLLKICINYHEEMSKDLSINPPSPCVLMAPSPT